MSQPQPAPGHAVHSAARWSLEGFPRFQIACECGWHTAVETSEQDAIDSHANHSRSPVGSSTWNPMAQRFDIPIVAPEPEPLTLADFLLARITEDERSSDPEYGHPDVVLHRFDCLELEAVERSDAECSCGMQDRWLAECAAKRKTVETFIVYTGGMEPDPKLEDEWAVALVLHALAEPYADHPDFRPEWRA